MYGVSNKSTLKEGLDLECVGYTEIRINARHIGIRNQDKFIAKATKVHQKVIVHGPL